MLQKGISSSWGAEGNESHFKSEITRFYALGEGTRVLKKGASTTHLPLLSPELELPAPSLWCPGHEHDGQQALGHEEDTGTILKDPLMSLFLPTLLGYHFAHVLNN